MNAPYPLPGPLPGSHALRVAQTKAFRVSEGPKFTRVFTSPGEWCRLDNPTHRTNVRRGLTAPASLTVYAMVSR